MFVGIIATLLLSSTPIKEESDAEAPAEQHSITRQFTDTFRLLGTPIVLLSFFGIMCHCEIDVGTNATAPKILQERLGISLNEIAFATSLYFIFRTIGCLTGSFFLRILKTRTFFTISIGMMAASMLCLAIGDNKATLYTGITLVGYGKSNVFSICLPQALLSLPEKKNVVSGLMIIGLFSGTVFPLIMGFASDATGQIGAILDMNVGVVYLLSYIPRVIYNPRPITIHGIETYKIGMKD